MIVKSITNKRKLPRSYILQFLFSFSGSRTSQYYSNFWSYCLISLQFHQIHSWRVWEDEAHMDRHDSLTGNKQQSSYYSSCELFCWIIIVNNISLLDVLTLLYCSICNPWRDILVLDFLWAMWYCFYYIHL